ncbi:MAG: P-loop NTPase [Candidatus Aenigmarchaeota archaeon]|nr:P-loop NTPase [Candidatus Aenigmarchaeota archaeon]
MHEDTQGAGLFQRRAERLKGNLSKIRYKIAVMSGKGGVGKTTVAVNLACMLAKKGNAVGLLDADIDCPNVAQMMNIEEKFEKDDNGFIPPEKYGVKASSMSLIEMESGPTMWRGPLIHSAIMQLMELTNWDSLDYLIIDMPPGTSDAALTVMQFIGIDAVVVVTTSQELSMTDATKSAKMALGFYKPVGIVENMSGEVFGSGGGETIAGELSVPFLGRIELSKQMRDCCDRGAPAVVNNVNVKNFEVIANNLEKVLAG